MNKYTYYILPGMGPEEIEESGNLYDLLASIPYLFNRKRLPPVEVINSILRKGIHDSGMSGGTRWQPFTISEEEYIDLSSHCLALGFEIAQTPSWVTTMKYFQIWEFEKDHGIPADKHKELSDAAEESDRMVRAAIDEGKSDEEIEKLDLQAYYAGQAVADLVNKYLG